MKTGFIPIRADEFADLVHEENPDLDRAEIVESVLDALESYRKGVRCECGNEIWVVGAAFAGLACFQCITGQSDPDNEYEIEGACEPVGQGARPMERPPSRISDDYEAKLRLWAANPTVVGMPRIKNLPSFGHKKFDSYEEFNAWKQELLDQIAAAGGIEWTK